jgi:hypothetical protein
MRGLPGVPGSCPGAVAAHMLSRLAGLFPVGAGGIEGPPGNNGPCSVIC